MKAKTSGFARSRRQGQRGQLLPLMAVGVFAVLGMIALAVDVGFWRYQQRLEQSAADSAAIAGAIQLNYPTAGSTSTPQLAAAAAATQNGFTDDAGIGNEAVTVSAPYTTVPSYAGATPYPANAAVQVVVQRKNQQFFSGIFGASNASTSARAVAVVQPDYSACLYQLDLTKGIGLTIKGNKSLQTLKCGVVANGTISVPGYIGTTAVGYWEANNPGGISKQIFPTYALSAPATDPCARIAGCAYLTNQFATNQVPVTAPPGAVDASIIKIITAPSGVAYVTNCCSTGATFGPGGIYYVYGGVTGTITSDAATIVNVDGGFSASGLGSGHPYFSAPSASVIPPATVPPTSGVAYYQPPSNTSAITLNGGGNGTTGWNGLFYSPTASLTSNGGSIYMGYTIVGDLRLNGGGNGLGIVIDPTLGGLTNPLPGSYPTQVVLSE